MTIRDIARIANVSAATVSKVFNKKDGNISPETRERVLQAIKECNYTPYASIRSNPQETTLLIGVMLDSASIRKTKLTAIIDTLYSRGYTAVVSVCRTPTEEAKKLAQLSSCSIDGLLWIRSEELEHEAVPDTVPYIILEDDCVLADIHHAGISYDAAARKATAELLERKHRRILCLVPDSSAKCAHFINGYKRRMMESACDSDAYDIHGVSDEDLRLLLPQYTAVLCLGTGMAENIMETAGNLNISVPKELSVLCADLSDSEHDLSNDISTVRADSASIARACANRLIDALEGKNPRQDSTEDLPTTLTCSGTVEASPHAASRQIIVVGAMNMDTYYSIDSALRQGEQIQATNCIRLPGGKGLNQAVGVARLGVPIQLISCCGKDYEGSVIYNYLKKNSVGAEGISFSSEMKTGSCQILISDSGETIIVGYNGASNLLSPEHIVQNESMFKNASFCLVQDLADGLIEQTVKTAHAHECKVLLRGGRSMETLALNGVDIFMPNQKLLKSLLPDERSIEEKAQVFLDRGAGCVIVTMGHRGCYLRDAKHSQFFPAINVTPLDTTGAADEFAATLCVYLSEGKPIEEAIRYATVAAGLFTTRHGAPVSMVDRETIELYMARNMIP